jgi:hypothetical protein
MVAVHIHPHPQLKRLRRLLSKVEITITVCLVHRHTHLRPCLGQCWALGSFEIVGRFPGIWYLFVKISNLQWVYILLSKAFVFWFQEWFCTVFFCFLYHVINRKQINKCSFFPLSLTNFFFDNPGQRIRQRILSDPVESNQPTKFDRILGCGPIFGSLVLGSDGILVSEFDGTYRWLLTDL